MNTITFNPKVSIIIPVYNGSNYMREAIDSALAQTYKNIEILVINDGSNDNNATRDIALSYGDRIRYYEKENGGVATALNLGIEKMCGDYFSWLSHDDVYYPNKIERQILELSLLKNKMTIIYSNSEYVNYNLSVIHSTSFEFREARKHLENPIYAAIFGLISGCTLLIHRKALKKNCFNESLRYTQDYDLWHRILPKHSLHFIPDRLVKTRIHASQDFQRSNVIQKKEITNLWKRMLKSVTNEDYKLIRLSEYGLYKCLYDYFFYPLKESNNHEGMIKYLEKYLKQTENKYNPDVSQYKVTVIIPFYNRIEWTIESINSVINQTHSNWEILLINDNSTDDISLIEYISDGKKIKLLHNKGLKGVSNARNIGMDHATGDFVAFLDSDDLFNHKKLEKQLKFMLLCGADFSTTNYQRFYPNGSTEIMLSNKNNANIDKCYSTAPSMVMISKTIYKNKIYRFDPTKHIAEDVCLWLKIVQDYHLLLLNDVLTNFRVTDSSTYKSVKKQQKGQMNMLLFMYNELKINENIDFYHPLFSYLAGSTVNPGFKRQPIILRLLYPFYRLILIKRHGVFRVREHFDNKYR